jgi:hypothetical protein
VILVAAQRLVEVFVPSIGMQQFLDSSAHAKAGIKSISISRMGSIRSV